MSDRFTCPTIEEVLSWNNSGHLRIPYKVHGYWSSDSISIYISRSWVEQGAWEFKISHSSGGRDTTEVPGDEVAAYNFALAMMDAAVVVTKLKESHIPAIEASYQEYRQRVLDMELKLAEERRIAAEAEEARRLADPALGPYNAKVMIEKAITMAKDNGSVVIKGQLRGEDEEYTMIAVQNYDRASFYFTNKYRSRNGRLTRKQLLELLSTKMSTRVEITV